MNLFNLVRMAVAILSCGLPAFAQAPPPAPPPFPIGSLSAYPTVIQAGTRATLT